MCMLNKCQTSPWCSMANGFVGNGIKPANWQVIFIGFCGQSYCTVYVMCYVSVLAEYTRLNTCTCVKFHISLWQVYVKHPMVI